MPHSPASQFWTLFLRLMYKGERHHLPCPSASESWNADTIRAGHTQLLFVNVFSSHLAPTADDQAHGKSRGRWLDSRPVLAKLRSKAQLPPEVLEPLHAFRGDVRWHAAVTLALRLGAEVDVGRRTAC